MLLHGQLQASVERFADKPAVSIDGRSYSYRDIDRPRGWRWRCNSEASCAAIGWRCSCPMAST
jgi:hypothetical protein